MIDGIKTTLERYNISNKKHRLLVAVSGGVDSMVLLHILKSLHFNLLVAHVNFQLRGIEANEDEDFVEAYAKKLGIDFLSTRFKTKQYAEEKGISTQMAARELRFEWFDHVLKTRNYDFVALGTNLNDQLETSLINLAKGTGFKGLFGIDVIKGNRLRPMVFCSRKDIENYAESNGIAWREDSSNSETIYERNFIRHKIIPPLSSLNTAFEKNLRSTFQHLHDTDKYIALSLERDKIRYFSHEKAYKSLDIEKLKQHPNCNFLAFHFLTPFGFNASQIQNCLYNSTTGSEFHSDKYRMNINRGKAIIVQISFGEKTPISPVNVYFETKKVDSFNIRISDMFVQHPIHLKMDWLDVEKVNYNDAQSNEAYLSADKLVFPLKLRKWKAGDYFVPFGMKNHKKVSDFLIDNKISRNQKEETYVIESAGRIIWVVGHRIDNRFKIHPKTKKVYLMQLKNTTSN